MQPGRGANVEGAVGFNSRGERDRKSHCTRTMQNWGDLFSQKAAVLFW
jgi:hypothetical protein